MKQQNCRAAGIRNFEIRILAALLLLRYGGAAGIHTIQITIVRNMEPLCSRLNIDCISLQLSAQVETVTVHGLWKL